MKSAILFVLISLAAASSQAALKTETVTYREGDTTCKGYLAYDDAADSKRPGVLVVHEWMGLNDYAKKRANQLAEEGYVAFAADIYGKGTQAKDPKQAGGLAAKYKGDRALFRRRVTAALETLRKDPRVDDKKLAAIGYCFGGTGVLELARDGADLAGVVSFHGGLDAPADAEKKKIKAKILVLHGADDPHVPPAQVEAFEREMREAGADWQLNAYGGAVHAFTNPANGTDNSKGAAYNASADLRSWAAMELFFGEIFQ